MHFAAEEMGQNPVLVGVIRAFMLLLVPPLSLVSLYSACLRISLRILLAWGPQPVSSCSPVYFPSFSGLPFPASVCQEQRVDLVNFPIAVE